jgi:DNA modification methylase
MAEVESGRADLAVTSPPYWRIKDYGCAGQIGHGQSLHEYLTALFQAWVECHRALREGGRLCVNVGDQFARASVYGRYRVIPLHAEIILQCGRAGFDFLGSIIWRKKTTVNTSGGAVVMGSFPFPPNGIVELDYEYILIFKKPGKPKKAPPALREASRLSREEWKTYFSGHWDFAGARKKAAGHEAAFPEELPRRLVRMFSFAGDLVLDPFLGSGTTAKAALSLGRNAIGYEINPAFAEAALEAIRGACGNEGPKVRLSRGAGVPGAPSPGYAPGIPDARPGTETEKRAEDRALSAVIDVLPDCSIRLDAGRIVRFLGVKILKSRETSGYLREKVLGKKIFLRDEIDRDGVTAAYVYMKNRIFVNAYLLKAGLAAPDGTAHRLKARFESTAQGPETINRPTL